MITKDMADDFLRKMDEEAVRDMGPDAEKHYQELLKKKKKEQQDAPRAPLTHNPFAAAFDKKKQGN